MTHHEAVAEAERLAREHPERDSAAWFPKEQDAGEWVVLKVPRPASRQREELRTGFDETPRPDPSQDVPQEPRPYWGF